MPTVKESVGTSSQLENTLKAGLEVIDLDQHITFTLYQQTVLPLDGFVFWVKADILSPSALIGGTVPNAASANQGVTIAAPAQTLVVKGSLHYATDVHQDEEKTFAQRKVIFTSEELVNDLAALASTQIYIGEFEGVRFAFSQRQNFYRQADLFHYIGDAIYPDMESQIIDSPAGFDGMSLVVSNSLPVWLSFSLGATKPWEFAREAFPLYPSFAVPPNLTPPWGAVHIAPEETQALGSAPYIDLDGSSTQLFTDTVKVTLYGLRNNAAQDFVQAVIGFTQSNGAIGLMNMPGLSDEKETQRELNMLAMRKTVTFEVSYYQSRIREVAQTFIKHAVPNIVIENIL